MGLCWTSRLHTYNQFRVVPTGVLHWSIREALWQEVKVKSLSHVWLFETPWTVDCQAPPSMGFSRQEYWSGLPFPSPMHESEKWKWSRSVMSNSSQPHGLRPTRLLHPWDFPGKSTGVGCHCLLHLSVDGHLGCFHVLAIIKSAATMNTGVHASLSIMVFSGFIPSSGIVGSCVHECSLQLYGL